eukprot:3023709-Heterocapsa_arctica.AAC.1
MPTPPLVARRVTRLIPAATALHRQSPSCCAAPSPSLTGPHHTVPGTLSRSSTSTRYRTWWFGLLPTPR